MDTLSAQCDRLQETLATVNEGIEEFSRTYPPSQATLEPLTGEIANLQRATTSLRDKAAPFDDGVTPIPDDVFRGVKTVPANCIDNVLAVQQTLQDPSRQRQDWQGIVSMDVNRLVRALETGRRAIDVAVVGLDMATGVNQAEQTGDSPPYATTSIVPEILEIKMRLAEDRDRGANAVQALTLTEFLEALQRFASRQSGNLVPPNSTDHQGSMAVSDAASFQDSAGGGGSGGGGSGSFYAPGGSSRPPSPGQDSIAVDDLTQPTPAYSAIQLPPAPQRMDLLHVSRLPTLGSEVLGVAFDATARVPRVAVTVYHQRVRFFHMKIPEGKTIVQQLAGRFNINGTSMCLSPVGPLIAVVQEHMDDMSLSVYTRFETLRPRDVVHDGKTFADPEVVVINYAKQLPVMSPMRWPGARPFAFSPDGTWLAARGVRGRVEVVDVTNRGKGVGVVRGHTEDVFDARFTADGGELVTMGRDGTLRVTSTRTWQGTAKLEVAEWRNPVFLAVSATAGGSGVVVSVWGRRVYLWNPNTGALDKWSLDGYGGNSGEGWPLAASPDLRLLCCRTEQGADVRETATGRVLCRMGFGQGFASTAAFSKDSKYLTVGRAVTGHNSKESMGRVDFWEIIE
ncbi:hypothetical protein ACHAQA_010139 [Verticillium albo-atrum]